MRQPVVMKVEAMPEPPRIRPPPSFCNPEGDECAEQDGCCGGGGGPLSARSMTVEKNASGKLKTSCEGCSAAKVKCSGAMPCVRCKRKGLECVFLMEKKRGRRTNAKTNKELCNDATCWGQLVPNHVSKVDDLGAKFTKESLERRLFSAFFSMYKHHASPQSCCKSWFTYQLNKMSTFLFQNGNLEGSRKLDAWIASKGLNLTSRDPALYRKVPANVIDEVSGRPLPPIHPLKAPKMTIIEKPKVKQQKLSGNAGNVYSNRGFLSGNPKNTPIDLEIERMKQGAFFNLRATHERFEVEVNDEFVSLFGYTTRDLLIILQRLFGGLLPWGSDILGLLLAEEIDLLFFLQTMAIKMNHIGRPPQFPATRQAVSTHVFDFKTNNISATQEGDVVECVLRCVHREYLSLERTEIDIFFGFEPMMNDVPRHFRTLCNSNASMRVSGLPDGSRMAMNGAYVRPLPVSMAQQDNILHDDITQRTAAINFEGGNVPMQKQQQQQSHLAIPPNQDASYVQIPRGNDSVMEPEAPVADSFSSGNDWLSHMMDWAQERPTRQISSDPMFISGNDSLFSQLSFGNEDDEFLDSEMIPQQQQQQQQQQPAQQGQESCADDLLPPEEKNVNT